MKLLFKLSKLDDICFLSPPSKLPADAENCAILFVRISPWIDSSLIYDYASTFDGSPAGRCDLATGT